MAKNSTKKTTKKSTTKKPAKFSSTSPPRINPQERAFAKYRVLLKKLPLIELQGMERTLPDDWKKAAVVSRIEEIFRCRAEFVASLQSLDDFKLRKLTSSGSPMWQIEEATKVIQRREEEIIQTREKAFAIKCRLDRLHNVEVAGFRTYLCGLNLPKLRSLVSSFQDNWKNEEVANRIEFLISRNEILISRNYEREVEAFARSLLGKRIKELKALKHSTPKGWKHNEITKRLKEERLLQLAQEKAQFKDSLKGKSIETLRKLALTMPDGWKNDEICRRIIEMLPHLESEVLQDLSKISEVGLQRVMVMARDQIRVRKKRTGIKVVPKIRRGWT